MAKKSNFEFYEGEEDTVEVTVTNKDGSSLDLTGLTIEYVVEKEDGTEIISKNNGSGITITNAAGGVFEIIFAASDTTQPLGQYDHEVRLSETSYAETVLIGHLRIFDSLYIS